MHKKKAGKLQTGNTFPKQYWLAVHGKPKRVYHFCVILGVGVHLMLSKFL